MKAAFNPDAETVVPALPESGEEPISGDEATMLSPEAPKRRDPRLRRGQPVGRFMVVDRLGAGAMGEVVLAYDPDLHRRVAIKVVRAPQRGKIGQDATERMLREARAMAQLSHPNVITVFEVDQLADGQLFIAMEYVDGGTLRQWGRNEESRSYRDVLQVYVQAARGLAAAHAAGLVHRDFKPDNVLIDSEGRVRVTDFGLVGVDPSVGPSQDSDADVNISSSGSRRSGPVADVTLTRTGAIMGTPAYMSPEEGRAIDARSDQFSFCVALYEALYRQRPFAGETLADLRYNVLKGKIRDRPRGHDVPAWVHAIVLRGLSTEPNERWPDMNALIGALRSDPTARRRQLMIGAGGIAVVGGLVAWASLAQAQAEDPCGGGEARFAEVWNEDRADDMRSGFAAVADGASDGAEPLIAALDTFGTVWVGAHREACEANKVHRSQSDDLFDRRMRCLERKLQNASALALVFSNPTAEALGKAEHAGDSLPPLDSCGDAEALAAQVPPPDEPQRRDAWDRLHSDLDRADALGVAGNEIAALALYQASTPEILKLDHPPLSARLFLNHGNALVRQQRWVDALAVMETGPEVAARAGDAVVEAQMWLLLAKATGFGLNDAKSGATMARAAEVAAVRAGDAPNVQIGIQYTLSLLRDADADYEAAVKYAQKAVDLSTTTHGKQHDTTSVLLGNLGVLLDHAGRYDDAMEAHEASLAIDSALHSPEHPKVGHSLVNIGLLHQNKGEYDLAEDKFKQAIEIYEPTVGRKHGAYATALLNLAQNSFYRLRFDEARDRLLTLLELYRQTLPEIHEDIAKAHQNLGSAYRHLGDLDEAETHYRRAYQIRVEVFGPEHTNVMHSINAMSTILASKGKFEEAEKELRRAVKIGEKGLPPNHPDLAYPLQTLGNVIAEQERYEEALPFLERCVQLRADINPNLLGRSEFALARVLWFVDQPAADKMLTEASKKMDELGQKEVEQFRAMVQ